MGHLGRQGALVISLTCALNTWADCYAASSGPERMMAGDAWFSILVLQILLKWFRGEGGVPFASRLSTLTPATAAAIDLFSFLDALGKQFVRRKYTTIKRKSHG